MAAEDFFSRWSRRKRAGDSGEAFDEMAEQASGARHDSSALPPADAPPLTADDVNQLTLESDYAGFMSKEVDAALRRSAMKKLFFNPQLSVMDGLDIYIDDYNKTTPIPAAMLAALEQAKSFLAPKEESVSPAEEVGTAATDAAVVTELDQAATEDGQATSSESATDAEAGKTIAPEPFSEAESDQDSKAQEPGLAPTAADQALFAVDPSSESCPQHDRADPVIAPRGQEP